MRDVPSVSRLFVSCVSWKAETISHWSCMMNDLIFHSCTLSLSLSLARVKEIEYWKIDGFFKRASLKGLVMEESSALLVSHHHGHFSLYFFVHHPPSQKAMELIFIKEGTIPQCCESSLHCALSNLLVRNSPPPPSYLLEFFCLVRLYYSSDNLNRNKWYCWEFRNATKFNLEKWWQPSSFHTLSRASGREILSSDAQPFFAPQ